MPKNIFPVGMDPDDIVTKEGAAVMFGCWYGTPTHSIQRVNHLMRKGVIPEYDHVIGRRGVWRRKTLVEAREKMIATATDERPTPPLRKAAEA